ncbi:hypothetical protein LCGC14_2019980 [marine sediment metagenome]|uniref:Uncharacterized protein n=1 Tax=marine sediment metagenome TaxID=412755 RepID=A0A0F9EXW4_9ZZZZ
MKVCLLCKGTGYLELWWPEMGVLIGIARCIHPGYAVVGEPNK